MTKPVSTYPNVFCRKHSDREPRPGYVVCGHPQRTVRQLPTEDEAGVIACGPCEALLRIVDETDGPRQGIPVDLADLFHPACADCAAGLMAN